MRRVTLLCSLSLLLLGVLLPGALAQVVNAGNNLYDINLRDADLSSVLTALFNSTEGKYQVQLSSGVNGRVNRLAISQQPFEKVLDAILGTDYSYTKKQTGDGTYLYTITGRRGGTSVYSPRSSAFQAPPTYDLPSVFGGGGGTTSGGGGTFAFPGSTSNTGGAGGAGTDTGFPSFGGRTTPGASGTNDNTTGSAAAEETSVVRLIRINNLDVGLLAQMLGGESIDLTGLLNSGMLGGVSGGSMGGFSNNTGYNPGTTGYSGTTGSTNTNTGYGTGTTNTATTGGIRY